jgi:hypothetical protein
VGYSRTRITDPDHLGYYEGIPEIRMDDIPEFLYAFPLASKLGNSQWLGGFTVEQPDGEGRYGYIKDSSGTVKLLDIAELEFPSDPIKVDFSHTHISERSDFFFNPCSLFAWALMQELPVDLRIPQTILALSSHHMFFCDTSTAAVIGSGASLDARLKQSYYDEAVRWCEYWNDNDFMFGVSLPKDQYFVNSSRPLIGCYMKTPYMTYEGLSNGTRYHTRVDDRSSEVGRPASFFIPSHLDPLECHFCGFHIRTAILRPDADGDVDWDTNWLKILGSGCHYCTSRIDLIRKFTRLEAAQALKQQTAAADAELKRTGGWGRNVARNDTDPQAGWGKQSKDSSGWGTPKRPRSS